MRKYLKYVGIIIILGGLQSCFTAKEYQRPENKELLTDNYFRTDKLPQDSLSMANISWQELFSDQKLKSHITKALENNLDIRMALKNIDIAESYLAQGKAAYFPTISAGATYSGSYPSLNSPSGMGLEKRKFQNLFDLGGDISWEPDIWGRIKSNERAANATYLQTVSVHQTVKSELVSAIASIYYQLLALDEQKRITEETIQNREESVNTIKALKTAGVVNEVAVQQTEAQLLNAKSLLLDTENGIKLLENTFSILLGEEPHAIDRGKLENQKINAEMKIGIPVELLSNRPDVMSAEYGLINAFELTNAARSNFYPQLRIGAGGGIQSLEFDKLFSANSLFASILGGLTQPILNGRQVRTQYEVSQHAQENALLNYKKTVLNASREVSDALYTYDTNVKKRDLKQEEYEAYKNAIEYSEQLLNYGMINYLDVLVARESALNAQLSVINADLGRLTAVVDLYKAVGGGWR